MPWKPANGHHAIERATASIVFRDGLTQHAHSQAVNVLTRSALKLGLTETVILPPPVQVNFVQSGNAPSPVPQQVVGLPAGRGFRRTEEGKPQEEALLTADLLSLSTYSYGRWATFYERLNSLLPELFMIVSATTAISEVRLEYWDRFDRRPVSDQDEPLTNPLSQLVGAGLLSETGSWHTHIGLFCDLEPDRRTLINANVDAIASMPNHPQTFSGGVTGQARIYTLASTQATGDGNPLGDWKIAYGELDRIHHILKSVLDDIVHPDISKAINLNANPLKLR
jgi:uncharacterized protein (TIGR04255 family)